jgi:hypothetical protein
VQGEGPVVAAVERGLRHVIPEQARADGMTLGAHTLAILVLPERVDASVRTTDAVFRHFGHFDFGNHVTDGGIPPRELDARLLAHHAAATVAADEVLLAHRATVAERDVDAGVVLRETVPRWSSISMVRACNPPPREFGRSWFSRRSTMAASTRASASSAASIRPVGPPPAVITA